MATFSIIKKTNIFHINSAKTKNTQPGCKNGTLGPPKILISSLQYTKKASE